MARNGYPDDPDYSSGNYSEAEPTQYANYGGTSGEAYSEYGPPADYPPPGYTAPTAPVAGTGRHPAAVPPPTPWNQRPAVLVGLGVLTALVLALLVYAVVKFTTAGTKESPAVTSSSAATTSSAPTTASSSTAEPSPSTATETVAPSPSTTAAPPPPPTTVTTTVTPTTTAAPTTTETPTPSTTTTVTTSVTTVTETTTKPLFPNWPRPTRPTLMEPAPAG